MADTVSVITLLVAIATALVAVLTYRSQKRVEELQLMMQQQDIDQRKIRAEIALARLEQMINIVCNWTDSFNITHELLRSISDWPNEVASLPDSKLKFRSEDSFRRLVINSEPTIEFLVTQTLHSQFSQLRDDLPVLVEECREKLKSEIQKIPHLITRWGHAYSSFH